MSLLRLFAAALVVPPLVVLFPAAILFLAHVTRVSASRLIWMAAMCAVAYAVGALLAGIVLRRAAARVAEDVAASRDASASVSSALGTTAFTGAALWGGWGLIINMAACAFIAPTFLGFQYFVVAALIVAAPAMAWDYWVGKSLLARITGARPVDYTGRVYSIGVKIAIVFIGFYSVSAGVLVLVVSSRVAERLGDQMAYEMTKFGVAVALGTSAIFALATWFLARDVTRPAVELMRLSRDLAQGRFSSDVRIFSDDEFGVLGKSFADTRTNLRALVAHVGQRGETIAEGVRAMSSGTDALVENVHEQSGMAARSTVALGAVQDATQSVLSEAERVTRLTLDSASGAAELRASVIEVARRMDELFQSVEKSASAATEIDAAARETATRTTSVDAIGSDVLSFVAQLDATTRQITDTARDTANLSRDVREQALDGRSAVDATATAIRGTQEATRRTSEAFESLRQSLGKIGGILQFIDEVTNRTNLLSLNAAIIAAQAGQNDHGFSVIADEIRQLAERTRSATKEIAAIIRGVEPVTNEAVNALGASVKSVDETVALAHHASTSLGAIVTSSDRSLEMTGSISRALDEQVQAARHLHSVASRMSDDIAEMRRAAEGQADATRLLAVEAERVTDIAYQVKRATDEQMTAADGIAGAMEQIASDVDSIRDRLDRQLHHAEEIAGSSRLTLDIAQKNNGIAEQFRSSLQRLLHAGREFETEVARFR
jgi:methyl-accepting chemotaxis protein